MALTPSTMLPLGTQAPDFTLPDPLNQKNVSLQEVKSDVATVVMFICNHCPFVIHIQHQLVALAKHYQAQGVGFVAISANDIVNYPDDAPAKMAELAAELDFSFPYLYDESQQIAKAYHAACTPDFFVFDKNLQCVYRGRFDDSTPGKDTPVTGKELAAALDALLAGQAVSAEQHPSMGCNIKWKQ